MTRDEPFSRVTDALLMSFAAFVEGMMSATICATAICAKAYEPINALVDKWFDWMLSDAGAALLRTPFLLLCWARRSFLPVIRKQPGVFRIITATSILAVAYLLFGTSGVLAADAGASFLILAVYHAKRGGRRTWQWYVPEVSTSPRE